VKLSDVPITETQAETYLQHDLSKALSATLRCCPLLAAEPPARLAAIVDFTFNLGAGQLQASTLRRRINQQDWPGAAAELRRWVYAGAKVLPGLVARREAECGLLMTV
jgi:lysozyme